MKILMIGWGFPPNIQGGLDTHVCEVSRELSKKNEVLLALPEFNCPEDAGEIKTIPIKAMAFTDMMSLLASVREYNKNIIKECSHLDFDVIHSHDWFGVLASEGLRKESGEPWVLTIHSLEWMRSGSAGKSIMQSLESRGMKGCDRLIAVSRYMRKEMEAACSRNDIHVVYNAANPGKSNPQKIRRELGLGNKRIVLFMGRLSQQKGVEYLVKAAKIVTDEMPDARFIIAGDGHLKGSLERFASCLGLDEKVIFTGFVPQEDIYSYYAAADVFAYPSVSEPFGIAVLESLLSGTPVITSKSAGVLERIDRLGCISTTAISSDEIAAKIICSLRSRKRVTQSQMDAINKAYSWGKTASSLMEIYKGARNPRL